jgi:hypothetical protein
MINGDFFMLLSVSEKSQELLGTLVKGQGSPLLGGARDTQLSLTVASQGLQAYCEILEGFLFCFILFYF